MPRGDIPNFELLGPDARARVERSENDPAFARGFQTAQLEFMLAAHENCKAERVEKEKTLDEDVEELKLEKAKLIGVLVFLGFVIPILVTVALELWLKS